MLVVDDNAANRSVLETWARRFQMSCVTAAGAEQARNLTILIVEDSAVNQKVAQPLLKRFGFRSDVAASRGGTIAALEQRDYDLVLMDIQTPDMDGLEATRQIRARWPDRPLRIVAMTANVAPEDVGRCQDVGMDGFLGKPIAVHALARVLSEPAEPAAARRGA